MVRFDYGTSHRPQDNLLPRLPLTLLLGNQSVDVVGMLDTGATVSVIPYPVGLALGAVWNRQTTPIALTGNLGQFEARALLVDAYHPEITPIMPVKLAFAWSLLENAPIIFGQMNFFLEFDVCFYRSQGQFDIRPQKS